MEPMTKARRLSGRNFKIFSLFAADKIGFCYAFFYCRKEMWRGSYCRQEIWRGFCCQKEIWRGFYCRKEIWRSFFCRKEMWRFFSCFLWPERNLTRFFLSERDLTLFFLFFLVFLAVYYLLDAGRRQVWNMGNYYVVHCPQWFWLLWCVVFLVLIFTFFFWVEKIRVGFSSFHFFNQKNTYQWKNGIEQRFSVPTIIKSSKHTKSSKISCRIYRVRAIFWHNCWSGAVPHLSNRMKRSNL